MAQLNVIIFWLIKLLPVFINAVCDDMLDAGPSLLLRVLIVNIIGRVVDIRELSLTPTMSVFKLLCVHTLAVGFKFTESMIPLMAPIASIRFYLSMSSNMLPKISTRCEIFFAEFAFIWPLTSMNALMHLVI